MKNYAQIFMEMSEVVLIRCSVLLCAGLAGLLWELVQTEEIPTYTPHPSGWRLCNVILWKDTMSLFLYEPRILYSHISL